MKKSLREKNFYEECKAYIYIYIGDAIFFVLSNYGSGVD